MCYDDNLIKIRLNHAKTGAPLKYSSLVDTLCHELAHLQHFDHGPEFKDFFFELLGWARQQGIYRPGPAHGRWQPASSNRLLPITGLPQRNGVPVFPDSGEDPGVELPWDVAPPAPPAKPPVGGRPHRPQQLSLF